MATLQKLVGKVGSAAKEIAHIVKQFLPVVIYVVEGISQQFVSLVLPIHNINAGVSIVSGSDYNGDGGKIVLVFVKVSGRITAVVAKGRLVGRNIIPFKILIPDEDTSAVIREIRGTHNSIFLVSLYYFANPVPNWAKD